jgi:hypothetical protein
MLCPCVLFGLCEDLSLFPYIVTVNYFVLKAAQMP